MSLRFARPARSSKQGILLLIGFLLAASVSMVVASYGSASSPKQEPGYWLASPSGTVTNFGNAANFGALDGKVSSPVVGIVSTPDAGGYWLVASNGGIFAFGDAKLFGSMAGKYLSKPVVGMTSTADGRGYWLVAADGGVFAFGDAAYFGSGGTSHLTSPVVSMSVAPDGAGYWLATRSGVVLRFGKLPFNGAGAAVPAGLTVAGMAPTPDGKGYWLVTNAGKVLAFGDAHNYGSMSTPQANTTIVGIAPTSDGRGYWLAARDGGVLAFGDAQSIGSGTSQLLAEDRDGLGNEVVSGIAVSFRSRHHHATTTTTTSAPDTSSTTGTTSAPGGSTATPTTAPTTTESSTNTPSTTGAKTGITPVGSLATGGGTGPSSPTSLSVDPQTVGDLMILGVEVSNSTPPTISEVSGGGVSSWSRAVGDDDTTYTQDDLEIWEGVVTSTGPSTINIAASGFSDGDDLLAQEFAAGAGAVWSVDTSGKVTGTSNANFNYPSLTPSGSSELYWGMGTAINSTNLLGGGTPGVNYIETGLECISLTAEDTDTSSTLAPAVSNSSGSGNWETAVAVLIRATGGSGATTATTNSGPTTTTMQSTTTTAQATTTTGHATTSTTAQATTTTAAANGANCSSPSSVVPYDPNNAQNGVQEGNFYVTNDTWNASGYSVAQTLYVCNYNSWYVIANMNNDTGDGAVKTSPNVQETWSNGTPISGYSSINSSYGDVPPSNLESSDIFEFEYDIWLGSLGPSNGSTEVMIWTWNHNQTPGGSEIGTTTIDGVTYDVWRSAPPQQLVSFEAVGGDQSLSGSVNISDFFSYMISQGWISSGAEMYQIDHGVELVSTSSQNEQFGINNFNLTLTPTGGTSGGTTTTTHPTTTTTAASTTTTTQPTTSTTRPTSTTGGPTTTAVTANGSAPTSPPVTWCESGFSDPYSSAPSGAVTVPAGDNSALFAGQLPNNTIYWFASGTHTIGAGAYSQIQPGDGDTFIGAPGAIISGQNQNNYAFEGSYNDTSNENVTIEYLAIENFDPNQGSGAVNGNGNNGWTEEYNLIQDISPGAGLMLGGNNIVKDNCMTKNGEYGFQGYSYVDETYEDTFTGGATNITFTGNEVSYNNTQGTSGGIEGGGKFWHNGDVTVTDNYVHNNYDSPGLWMDTDNAGFLVQGNYFSDNGSEGLMYEISYNADITDNTFVDNANVTGPTNPGFPDSAIYISESGGNSSVPSTYAGELDITNNVFDDNWGGVVLWQNPNRFAGDGQDPGTLTPPAGEDIGTWINNAASVCPSNLAETSPIDYHDLCHWYTQNVLVANNSFSFNPSDIGSDCTQANGCGFNAVFAAVSSTSAYPGWTICNAISNLQNNVFKDNTYSGPWSFMYFNQGDIATFAQWQAGESNVEASGYNFGPQDAGSTYTS